MATGGKPFHHRFRTAQSPIPARLFANKCLMLDVQCYRLRVIFSKPYKTTIPYRQWTSLPSESRMRQYLPASILKTRSVMFHNRADIGRSRRHAPCSRGYVLRETSVCHETGDGDGRWRASLLHAIGSPSHATSLPVASKTLRPIRRLHARLTSSI
jgi:hypothetical protein